MVRPDQEFRGAFWVDRGIGHDVASRRGYIVYECGEVEKVMPHFDALSPKQRVSIRNKVNEVSGLAIIRFAVLGGLERPLPELRPDEAIDMSRPSFHWHGFGGTPNRDFFYAKLDPQSQSGLAHRWKWHVEPEGVMTREKKARLEAGEEPGNTEEVHPKESPGKYHFAPSGTKPEVWQHDHAVAYKPHQKLIKLGKYSNELYPEEAWAMHISKYHPEIDAAIADAWKYSLANPGAKVTLSDVVGPHSHVRREKDPENNYAQRLDIHPWAAERLEATRLVYFGIEGCLKADAILTAILKEDRPESVFSVPSVSLWGAPELAEFIEKRLKGKTVVIVPDADWIDNPLVIEQARMCRTYLRRHGLEAYVAAPPADRLDEGIKGVDDYLGKGDSALDGLMVQERRVDEYTLTVFLARRILNRATKERAFTALWGLAAHASEDGVYRGTLAKLAWVMGVDRKRVERGLRDLEELGAVEIVGSLESRKHYFTGRPELVDPEACVVLAPELRGRDLSEYPLGELVADLEFKEEMRKRLAGKAR